MLIRQISEGSQASWRTHNDSDKLEKQSVTLRGKPVQSIEKKEVIYRILTNKYKYIIIIPDFYKSKGRKEGRLYNWTNE